MDNQNNGNVVIVGSGIIGLYTAYFLSLTGRHVELIDPHDPGSQCSYGNAGSISTSSVAPFGMPNILRQIPKMLLDPTGPVSVPVSYWWKALPWFSQFILASRMHRVNIISKALHSIVYPALEYHKKVMQDVGGLDLIQTTGQLHLYPNDDALAKDDATWALRLQLGAILEKVDRDRIQHLEPKVGELYQTGYYLPDQSMVVNPLRQAQLIAVALEKRGVRFLRDRVIRIDVEGARVTGVSGQKTNYTADDVVICAGAWSGRLLSALGYSVPLEAQRGYHVSVPNGGVDLTRIVCAADRKIFYTPTEAGLRIAGTVEFGGLERAPNKRRAELLLRHSRLMFPSLNLNVPTSDWMGHRPCLPDSLPVIGPAPKHRGLWLNFGHGHLGLTMSAISGSLLSETMGGVDPKVDMEPFCLGRFNG
ncbi:NAD(P)/FAD-dependent oxidoreductase [Allopusillimonas ginsengisoli]|uniref:NAD(P)/FAD-dependent oxidoreductase n=1 Tax=Allopusillimonas ginsengisoli TaxID=453575 RepID=UPI001020B33D|nr:FAD-dependent oxidoreductase [Allopusillimonas ginsengisoli]TEA74175.1 FAD-dependent oxidoreductase [Allopusillimonas ginsengisoli]